MTEEDYIKNADEILDPRNIDCSIEDIIAGKHLTKPILSEADIEKQKKLEELQQEIAKEQEKAAKEQARTFKQQEKSAKEAAKEAKSNEKLTKVREKKIEELYMELKKYHLDEKFDVKYLSSLSDAELLKFKCDLDTTRNNKLKLMFADPHFVTTFGINIVKAVEEPIKIIDGYSETLKQCQDEIELELTSLMQQGKFNKILDYITPLNMLILTLGRNLVTVVGKNIKKRKTGFFSHAEESENKNVTSSQASAKPSLDIPAFTGQSNVGSSVSSSSGSLAGLVW